MIRSFPGLIVRSMNGHKRANVFCIVAFCIDSSISKAARDIPIQIESNRIALQTHLKMSAPDGTTYVCRIKKVKYDVDNKDKEESYVRFYQKGMDFSESFFHKRAAFAHEDEVRVLLMQR